ncbi:Intraflagellar transport protein 27-like [Symbiodinium microadriaticum]|uniref:Intraflagellar transport protein 27-like n=1 Tax=Symbiodinium microadriaticum TaxID=2951 RepID=A0A1Q9CCI7_SYMMI|nr:Intraflagellar transport protein 27-like [Symbiodinium microadriaticum]
MLMEALLNNYSNSSNINDHHHNHHDDDDNHDHNHDHDRDGGEDDHDQDETINDRVHDDDDNDTNDSSAECDRLPPALARSDGWGRASNIEGAMNDMSLPPPPPPPPPPEEQAFDGNPFGSLVQPAPLILRCKVVLLGDSASGKTSLAQVFQGGAQSFPKNYNMTIGIDFLVKRVSIPDTNVVVELYIVDCGGFAVCQDVLRPHWENANAVMLVYDVSNPESFGHLEDWYAQLKHARADTAISGVVIATKMDLLDRPGCVSSEQGHQFSGERGLEFFETCSGKGIVDAPFHFLAERFHHKYGERKAELENIH